MTRRLVRWGAAGACLFGMLVGGASAQTGVGSLQTRLRHAREALAEQNFPAAERDFSQVLQSDPRQPEATLGLGEVAMQRGQWQQALDWLDRAVKIQPSNSDIWLNRGLVYCNLHQFEEGLKNFRQVLRLRPESRQGRYLAGVTALYTGDSQAALAYLLPLDDRPPNHLEYYYDLSTAAQMENRNALSETALQQLKQNGDDSPAYHLLLGRAYLNHNQPEQALPELQKVAAEVPQLPLLHFTLGIAFQNLHQYAQARSEFQKDLKFAPGNALDYQRLGEIDSHFHSDQQARADEQHALALAPNLAISQLELGTADLRLGLYAEAEKALKQAIALYPPGARAHYVLGRVLQRTHRPKDAAREFARASSLEQQNQGKLQRNFAGGLLTPVDDEAAAPPHP